MGDYKSEFVVVFNRTEHDYAYTDCLTDTDWAWEYLRRNPDYISTYYESRTRPHRMIAHATGVKIYRDRCNNNQSRKWGLTTFAPPDFHALKTDIFWSRNALTHCVSAISTCTKPNQDNDLDLFRDQNCCAILCLAKCQKVIIRSRNAAIDMRLVGVSILFQPVQLQFQLDGFSTIADDTRALIWTRNALKSLCSGDKKPLTKTTKLYRKKCLIALDCMQFGGSLRDTAFVFQSLGLTRLSWSASGDEALKKQVWRCRNMGQKLMQGGYRNLL